MATADSRYQRLLWDVVVPETSNTTTFARDLLRFGRTLFGTAFHGVYMRDEVPRFGRRRPYAILNLDASHKNGSHWIALAFLRPKQLLVYDSFGSLHDMPEEILAKYPKSIPTDPDAEQRADEKNCGQRCLAWLLLFDIYGARDAARI